MYRSLRLYELEIEQDRDAARDRWLAPGITDDSTILQAIVTGAGYGFLAALRSSGIVTVPLSDRDLCGLPILQAPAGRTAISTPTDTLDDVDLTYANVQNVTFDAAFLASNIAHGTIANVTFHNCTFFTVRIAYCEVFGVVFDHCDFVRSHFLNCDMVNSQFRDCYWNESTFEDCRCDATVTVDNPSTLMRRRETPGLTAVPQTEPGLSGLELAGFYMRLSESFRTGSSFSQARRFEFLANQTTRRSRARRYDATVDLLVEATTGYGLRPLRVAVLMILLVLVGGSYFRGA
jgi:hypothetical protein